MKKLLALVLALVMVLGLAACGQTAAPAATEAPATAEPTEEPTPEPTEEPAAEPTVMTFEEFAAAELDSEVTVETYVQAKQSWWEDKATFYTQAEDGAYFLYNMACSEEEFNELVPGTKIRVTGFKSEWAGEIEITDATYEILEAEPFLAEAKDVTELLGTDELAASQNQLVAFKGMTVEPYDESGAAFAYKNENDKTDDLYFKVSKDGTTYDFCVEFYLCGKDTEVYQAVEALNVGDVVDLEGFLYWYEGPNPHITSLTVVEAAPAAPAVMSYADFAAADLDTEVTVETYVQAKQSWWEDKATVYTQDEDGAYFLYNMACSEEEYAELVPGAKIRVTGFKSEWSGEVEIVDAHFELLEADPYIAEPVDATELLGTDELIGRQNQLVSFKGLTVEPYDESGAAFAYKNEADKTDDLYFKVSKDGQVYDFCVEYYLCNEETDIYKAVEALNVGDEIDVEAFLYWYEGPNPHVIGMGVVKPAEEPAEEALEEAAAAEVEAAEAAAVEAAAAEEAVETAAAAEVQTLTAKAPGVFGEDVVVEVVADANGIYSVEVTENNETQGIGSIAVAELPAKIVEAQSVEIDGIAGATMTSNAIKTAVAAALAEAGIDPANFAAPEAEAEEAPVAEDAEYNVDVVVVGAGGAGMTAAITAHDAGRDVLVLESQAMVGGNSVRSTGGMNAAKTEWQDANEFDQAAGVEATLAKVANYPDNEEIQALGAIVAEQWAAYQEKPEGYFDSTELFRLDTMIGGGAMNNPELVKTLAENSEAAIAWLGELDPQVILHNVAAFGGASVKRIHRPVDADGKVLSVGAYVVPLLKENLDARGVTVLLNTTATEIVLDENGAACGVIATGPDGETVTVNAKAVVITTGGFGANNDMIASVRPELDGFITTNAPGIQGQGIQMAQAIGADTVDLEQIQLHPTVHVEGPNAVLITEGLRGDGAILVNQEGLRFFDEVSTRDKVSAAEFEQTGGYAWLIVDSRMSDASNVIQGYISKGYAVSGETYEELAEAIGAPADVFAATMADWNEKVAAKEDADFGRVSFANPLDQAPYYAIKVQPGIHHTMGGIKIDSAAQVIDTEGNVIAGLFAAGEVTGGVHGNNRLGGNAVADFTIFGRIAGQSAADYVG